MVERLKKGTVIIKEGRVYALFHETNPTTNEVCEKCALREECESGIEVNKFSDLCLANDVPGDAFFLECSPIPSKRVCDIAYQQDFLEADLSSDEASAEL